VIALQPSRLEAWQSVDSDDLSAVALAKAEGVPLAVAKRVFGQDPTCPPKLGERRRKPIIEELNEVLVA
jgi:hypothetical protein